MAKQTVAVDGVEHVVETGEGHVTVLDAPKNINARVEINDERPAMKFPLKAWLDTRDVGLWEFAQKANSEGLRITYRIETHRDGDIDPSIPIADVEPMKKFRRLVKLTPASAQNAQPEQQTSTPSRPQQARPVAPEPVSDDYDPGPQDPNDYGTRGRVAEGKPWENTNSDGSLNLGSYAFTASVGMVELAYDLITKRLKDKGVDPNPDPKKVKAVATMLLDASDAAQCEVRSDHKVDRMDNSHTRARGAVRSVVEATGVPWELFTEPAGPESWVAHLRAEAASLLRLAVELDARGSVPVPKPTVHADTHEKPKACPDCGALGGDGFPGVACNCEPF